MCSRQGKGINCAALIIYPLVSGLVACAATLEMLPCLEPDVEASSTLRSRNPVHRSANDSLSDAVVDSEKNSVFSAGELGVRWKGDVGRRRLLLAVPGRASPACSLCSSVQFRRPAMICNIWNFLESDLSSARNWRR
jgi:hypothetical protein